MGKSTKTRKKPMNHLNYLYWVNKGYTEEEAREKLSIIGKQASDAFYKKKKENPEKYSKCFNTKIEYWIDKGYTEKEAKEKVKERQRTFTVESCIEKYGEEEGRRVYEDRQRRWQETLNSKSEEEKADINRAKDTMDYHRFVRKGYSIEDSKKMLEEYFIKRGFVYFTNEEDCKKYFIDLFDSNPSLYITRIHTLFNKYFKKYMFILWDDRSYDRSKFMEIFEEYLIKWVDFKKYDGKFKIKQSGISCHIWVGDYTFRSFNEFNFFVILKNLGIDFEVEKFYNNCNMRCDFYLPDYDMYIEIAGMIGLDSYDKKMEYKRKTFGSVIIEASNRANMKNRLLEEIAKRES